MCTLIRDELKVSERLAMQLQINELYIVITVNTINHELLALEYETLSCCIDERLVRADVADRVDNFFENMERSFLVKTNALCLSDFLRDADNYIDTLRDEEGRVFL